MWIFLIGCAAIEVGGLLAAFLFRKASLAKGVALSATWAGSLIAAVPTIGVLIKHEANPIHLSWNLPIGDFHVAMDPLSAVFMLPVLLLAPLTSTYGVAYLKEKSGIGAHFFFLNTLIVSMALLLVAQNSILFLLAWETMALSSFFLVIHDDHLQKVREAGWIYMIATHIGAIALLAFFGILGHHAGNFGFDRIAAATAISPTLKAVLFVLMLVGFGSKAGLFPLHIWLPEAHPAAPSHISALMSGVMIKMGIYGVLRSLTFLGPLSSAYGWILVAAGAAAGIVGILSALSQHNLKRLLAYSSVENIGIIVMGIGAGMLGVFWKLPALTFLGFGGALYHVMNHAVFKGLLFLGAGIVVHESGTREMHRMGGLLKTLPYTGALFLAGACAAAGLPPFNGFVSEFFIYAGGIHSAMVNGVPAILLSTVVLTSLALTGGLAAACYAKCAGLIFLGEPRVQLDRPPVEPGFMMRAPAVILAVLSLGMGFVAPTMLQIITPAIQVVAPGHDSTAAAVSGESLLPSLQGIVFVFAGFLGLFLMGALFLHLLTRSKSAENRVVPVWDCGYAKPASSMQYTPSSFTWPIVQLFLPILRIRTTLTPPAGYFPVASSLTTRIADRTRETVFAPLFTFFARLLLPLRILQHGHVHIYVIYVAATLIVLLFITSGN